MTNKNFLGFPHVLEAQQFSREWIEGPFYREVMFMDKLNLSEPIDVKWVCNILRNKMMVQLFYEESTRTRASFSAAMIILGGQVMFSTENARLFSSAAKGESLKDTIKVLCQYKPNVIVLRHYEDGASKIASEFSCGVPIINAGEGNGQHPTQALLDIITIKKELGIIDGINIAMVGDLLNGRTVRSLCYLLGKFKDVKIYFVSPDCAQMKEDIKEYLYRHDIWFDQTNDLRTVAHKVDVIYQTRIQKERGTNFNSNDRRLGYFTVNREILDLMKQSSITMHPLPKLDEVAPEVDDDPRAAYFRQAANGLYVRMALLKMILNP